MGLDLFRTADVERPCKGVTFGFTENGAGVFHLHYSADPKRDDAWAAKERLRYTSDAQWNKEQEIDARALDGQLIYPEFRDSMHVVKPIEIPERGCVFMAIDPHPRTPHAFLWVLIDQFSDWWFYRELWPSVVYGKNRTLKDADVENKFTIRDYAEAVARLEGNRLDFRHKNTDDEYALYVEGRGEKVVSRFMDQAGKGFNTSAYGQMDLSMHRVYNGLGIVCQDPVKSHETGENAIHDLLRPRYHSVRGEWPKAHISTDCPELILEIKRARYKSMRSASGDRELSQQPVEARSHMVDLVRYLATAPISYHASLETKRWVK